MEEPFDPLEAVTQQLQEQDLDGDLLSDSDTEQYEDLTVSDHESLDIEVDSADTDKPVDALDLPTVQSKPPFDVLDVILKLLEKGEQMNFGEQVDSQQPLKVDSVLESRQISTDQFYRALAWLRSRKSALGSGQMLIRVTDIPDKQLISYLTSIVSSPLAYLWSEDQRDAILERASQIIGERSGRSARPDFVRKVVIPGFEIKIQEPSMIEDNIGHKTWGSALILAEKLSKDQSLLKDPILELGSGTGVLGIVLAKMGHQVLATDLPQIVGNLEENYLLNGLEPTCEVLDWTDPKPFAATHDRYPTVILSDPIYSNQHPYWIVDVLECVLSKEHDARVLIQLPLRSRYEDTRALLWKLLDQMGLEAVESNDSRGYDDFGEQTFLFKLYRWR